MFFKVAVFYQIPAVTSSQCRVWHAIPQEGDGFVSVSSNTSLCDNVHSHA